MDSENPIEYDDPHYQPERYISSSEPLPQLLIATGAATFQASSNAASITVPSNAYITHLACSPNSTPAFAAVLAKKSTPRTDKDHGLSTFDMIQAGHIRTFWGHEDTITNLTAVDAFIGESLWATSSVDGTLRFWDNKSSSPDACLTVKSPNTSGLLSFDLSAGGNLLATGSELKGDEASVVFWDIRKPKDPLYAHTMTHSDDITSLEFFSGPADEQDVLLSGSADGLICISNPHEQDEEESVNSVVNWRCSIAKCGWAGPDSMGQPTIWSVSDMESFATWNYQLDPIGNHSDLRLANPEGEWETKNVIDVTWAADPVPLLASPSSSPGLGIWVGTSSGDIGLTTSASPESWTLDRMLRGGHSAIVRSILWVQESNCVISGGEDSRINIWPLGNASNMPSTRTPRSTDHDGDVVMGTGSPPQNRSGGKRINDESTAYAKPGKKSRTGHM